MKVLWLTSSPAGSNSYIKQNSLGRGWISSLGDVIKNLEDFELAVCFFNNTIKKYKFLHEGITYYPIKDKLSTLSKKILSKTFLTLWDNNTCDLLKVVEEYKPDIIQLFGTETGMGKIVGKTKIPIIIHIQGLINPIRSNWLPRGFNLTGVYINSSFKDLFLRRDLISEYLLLKKMAKREEYIIENSKYFFGRTDWDKRVLKILNPCSEYFHCNEVLRPLFYESKWEYKSNGNLKLVSILNPQIYKGLDIVLETSKILKNKTNIAFQWNIIGIENNNRIVKIIEKTKGMKFKDNSVYFSGPKQTNEIVSELLDSNIFIHPSHIDNSPNSVCEAMLMGMPVIAGNVGGVASLIETGQNGIYYNSQDPYDLASIISEIAFKIEDLKKLGKNARKDAVIRHDIYKIADTVIATYKYILHSS